MWTFYVIQVQVNMDIPTGWGNCRIRTARISNSVLTKRISKVLEKHLENCPYQLLHQVTPLHFGSHPQWGLLTKPQQKR